MDHRRVQSAHARPAQSSPYIHPPPRSSTNIAQLHSGPGLLNAHSPTTPTQHRVSSSFSGSQSGYLAFPQPQPYRSVSAGAQPRPNILGEGPIPDSPFVEEGASFSDYEGGGRSSFYQTTFQGSVYEFETPDRSPSLASEALTILSHDQDLIRKFQNGELHDSQEEWAKLVPPEAREVLSEHEVKRQGVIFELIKSEKDYVADLETLRDVYLDRLYKARPPVISPDKLEGFLFEVFWNYDKILGHHKRLLAALFERQRDQHPIIQSISDPVLETVLEFRDDYESYIKHYPLAEARHRREVKRNLAYKSFLGELIKDSRARKRDLITFISRPVTRLPRLNLILDQIKKYAPEGHQDSENMPLILTILSDFLKSTQPGIEAAESRVKFVSLSEHLAFRAGELIDLDLYSENRTIIHDGKVGKKSRSEFGGTVWTDVYAKLLDHYWLLTQDSEVSGIPRHHVTSRPIPLEYLRLGPFFGPAENRKADITEETSFREAMFRSTYPVYPFVVFHAAATLKRYVLFTNSEAAREKWKSAIEEAKTLRAIYMDANKLFAFSVISDGYLRAKTVLVPSLSPNTGFSGAPLSAATFLHQGRSFLVVSTETGVYVAFKNDPNKFSLVLRLPNVRRLQVLQHHGRLLMLFNDSIISYDLDPLAGVAIGTTAAYILDRTVLRLTPKHSGYVTWFRVGTLNDKDYVVYDHKGHRSTTIHLLEVQNGKFTPFNSKGFSLPTIANDAYFLVKRLAIVSTAGITIMDPHQPAAVNNIPDFSLSNSNAQLAALKGRCDAAKPLGIVPVNEEERLVIYDEHGCYVSRVGVPRRKCGYVRWESKAKSFVFREPHIILLGEDFIEIRHAETGQFKQMVESGRSGPGGGGASTGSGIRLLEEVGIGGWKGSLILGWKGEKNDKYGQSWALVEVLETAVIETPMTPPPALIEQAEERRRRDPGEGSSRNALALWDEWD